MNSSVPSAFEKEYANVLSFVSLIHCLHVSLAWPIALAPISFSSFTIAKAAKCAERPEFRRRADEPLGRNQSSLDGTDHQILHELRRLSRLSAVFHLGSDVAIVRAFTTRLFRLVLDSIDCIREHARGLREILCKSYYRP